MVSAQCVQASRQATVSVQPARKSSWDLATLLSPASQLIPKVIRSPLPRLGLFKDII
jgi:hypothetical protein